jgi:hypothetical protein
LNPVRSLSLLAALLSPRQLPGRRELASGACNCPSYKEEVSLQLAEVSDLFDVRLIEPLCGG